MPFKLLVLMDSLLQNLLKYNTKKYRNNSELTLEANCNELLEYLPLLHQIFCLSWQGCEQVPLQEWPLTVV